MIVDGPKAGADCPQARYPALPMMKSSLAHSYCVFLDDAMRDGEKAVVDRWVSEFDGLSVRFQRGVSGYYMIRQEPPT